MSNFVQSRRRERIDRGIKVRTDGLYALMSWRELAYLLAPRLLLIVGLLALPSLMPGMYWCRWAALFSSASAGICPPCSTPPSACRR